MPATPLAGLLVVDLSRHLPGPLAAKLLADLGARVVKIEEPRQGDPVRAAPPFKGGDSALATLLLAGVESVALDLEQPPARQILFDLLARADVLLATFRPGTLDRWGLGATAIREQFPYLVACALSGWGEDGPYASRAGHDLTYQALAGSLAPTAAMPAAPLADLTGAWSAVAAILAAVVARDRTGHGAVLDAALFDAAVHSHLAGWAAEAGAPHAVGEPHALAGALVCYRLYATADGGQLAVAALETKFWRRFCELVGRPDLVARQLSRDARDHDAVARLVAGKGRDEWQRLLAGEDLPVEVVLSPAEAAAHPQAKARGVLGCGPDGLPRLGFPARFDGERPRHEGTLPALGQHTQTWLAELGRGGGWKPAGVGRRASLGRLFQRAAARLRPRG